jgi:spermidine/putrescine ABC transporter ATP-binding subunit
MAEVKIQNLLKKFDEVTAVDQISLTVRSGEFLSLVGPSGCGKTTTLNLIAGFINPDDGEISIDGERINDVPIYRRKLGMVFQSYALFPHMTVMDNIAFGLRMQKLERPVIVKEVGKALELVRLPGVEKRYPRQLSGGQQQRIALARALVIHPKVLLLDEPLSNLDAKLRREMRIELKDIQKTVGITTIFVTHDQEEALSLSDRLAVMNKGRIEQIGSPVEIYELPRNEFVSSFIGETNILPATIMGVREKELLLNINEIRPITISRPPDFQLRMGDAVKISIRPEKLCFSMESGDLAHWLLGTVDHVVFLGNITYYTVKTQSHSMSVISQNLETKVYSVGDEVRLEYRPENCRIIHEE